MAIEYTKVGEETREAFYDTLLAFWDQRWDGKFQEEFLAWRYARRSHGETLVAMSGSKCIGLMDAFIRPYRIGNRQMLVREPCDWYCMPGNRGVGMRLMKRLLAQGDPLLGVGLPKGALAIAPRMNWTHLLDTDDFILPITARRVAAAILRKARLGDGSAAKYLPRGIRLRPSSTWARHNEVDGQVEELAPDNWPGDDWRDGQHGGAYAVAPVVTRGYVQWLASGPEALGKVICLAFRIKGALIGLTICRIEASKVGQKARLIHLESPKPEVGTLRWMIAENIQRVSFLDAESIHCRSSCPTINAALTSLRFRRTARDAVMMSLKDMPRPTGPVNVGFLRGDDAMIPSLIAE